MKLSLVKGSFVFVALLALSSLCATVAQDVAPEDIDPGTGLLVSERILGIQAQASFLKITNTLTDANTKLDPLTTVDASTITEPPQEFLDLGNSLAEIIGHSQLLIGIFKSITTQLTDEYASAIIDASTSLSTDVYAITTKLESIKPIFLKFHMIPFIKNMLDTASEMYKQFKPVFIARFNVDAGNQLDQLISKVYEDLDAKAQLFISDAATTP